MKLYEHPALADQWIGEDAHGALVQWPRNERGWVQRTPYTGLKRELVEVLAARARGTGWPGIGRGRPPRDGGRATGNLTIKRTDAEIEAWTKTAGERPVATWARDQLNAAAKLTRRG